jgi:hypothetical protein
MKHLSEILDQLKKINLVLTNIPFILISGYWFLFLIRKSDWYYNNIEIVDTIDLYLVTFLLIHVILFGDIYSNIKLIYTFSILIIIQLQVFYFFISESVYYSLYLSILTLPIIQTFFYLCKKMKS